MKYYDRLNEILEATGLCRSIFHITSDVWCSVAEVHGEDNKILMIYVGDNQPEMPYIETWMKCHWASELEYNPISTLSEGFKWLNESA